MTTPQNHFSFWLPARGVRWHNDCNLVFRGKKYQGSEKNSGEKEFALSLENS
jgi:hypothetical protein